MLSAADLDADQRACIDFIVEGEDSLVFADVGAGKTVIGLTAAKRSLERGQCSRWLIEAPRMVALNVWRQEVELWSHLNGLKVALAVGDEKERIAACESDAPIVVSNYDAIDWLYDYYPVKRSRENGKARRVDTLPFDAFMGDEIDKLKSVSTNRFKSVRNRVQQFKKRVGMTGTPTPNELLELWGQVYMVDGGQSFGGRSFIEWRRKNFYPIDFQQRDWVPLPGTFEKILAQLDGLVFRLEAKGIPPVVVRDPYFVDLPGSLRRLYDELEEELYAEIRDKGDDWILDPDNMGIAQGKLEQLCAGFSYVKREGEKKNSTVWHSEAKLDYLKKFNRVYRDKQVMVTYHFQEERRYIKALMHPHIRMLGESDAEDAKTIELWNTGDLPRIGVHPASGGHGLNLQKSGAHDIVSTTMPWSGGLFKQLCGRLARRGQAASEVNFWPILARNTVDELKLAVVTGRVGGLKKFLDALKDRRAA